MRLSVYRPEKLVEEGPSLLPKGCDFTSHGQGVVTIGFKGTKGKSGYFLLQEGCEGSSAGRIKADLKDILSKIPELEGTHGYGWR